jgi:pantetheine-phosphate adenylyltransferase
MTQNIAIYPGSFDPITNGHVDLVKRALRVFDKVIVAIATNAGKDTSLFTVEERLEMILRGLRAVSDFEYEFQMAMMNHRLKPNVETFFMMTGESQFYISSRLVKEVVSLGGNVEGLVPNNVLKKLNRKFRQEHR